MSEFSSEFNGSESTFQNWERQLRLLIVTYKLDANNAQVLIGMRLKGKASEWLHSRPKHIELSVKNLLAEMKKMFDHRESKLKHRKQFEQQVSKADKSFSTYYHEKVILANRIPIDDKEIIEYLIDGISSTQLRNQARLLRFDSRAELLAAFEDISLLETKNRDTKAWIKGTLEGHGLK